MCFNKRDIIITALEIKTKDKNLNRERLNDLHHHIANVRECFCFGPTFAWIFSNNSLPHHHIPSFPSILSAPTHSIFQRLSNWQSIDPTTFSLSSTPLHPSLPSLKSMVNHRNTPSQHLQFPCALLPLHAHLVKLQPCFNLILHLLCVCSLPAAHSWRETHSQRDWSLMRCKLQVSLNMLLQHVFIWLATTNNWMK